MAIGKSEIGNSLSETSSHSETPMTLLAVNTLRKCRLHIGFQHFPEWHPVPRLLVEGNLPEPRPTLWNYGMTGHEEHGRYWLLWPGVVNSYSVAGRDDQADDLLRFKSKSHKNKSQILCKTTLHRLSYNMATILKFPNLENEDQAYWWSDLNFTK